MKGSPLGPAGEDITWPDQVAPRGRKASSTRKNKPQTSNCNNTLNTTTTRYSTSYRPHYTGSRHTDHRTPAWTCGEPRMHTSNTRA